MKSLSHLHARQFQVQPSVKIESVIEKIYIRNSFSFRNAQVNYIETLRFLFNLTLNHLDHLRYLLYHLHYLHYLYRLHRLHHLHYLLFLLVLLQVNRLEVNVLIVQMG